jgi:hypothetical protein
MATKINTPVPVGEFATFGFTTDLVEPYRFQWKRNGIFVGGNNKSYTTPPLRPEDFKAKYSVIVHGQDKSEESDAVVLGDVVVRPSAKPGPPPTPPVGTVAPKITAQPTSVSVSAGQPASFSVQATGTPPIAYQWQKNGVTIPNAVSSTYSIPTTTLADNDSKFIVMVSNMAGTIPSDAAVLGVK